MSVTPHIVMAPLGDNPPKATLFYGRSALESLRALPDNSVNVVCTSPPYWGLRDYGTEPETWPDGWTGSLGLEPTPDLFVEHLVLIFRELRRVLHPTGTFWLNLGDSYMSHIAYDHTNLGGREGERKKDEEGYGDAIIIGKPNVEGLKDKDLVGVPWRAALALQADGWWLRNCIIWHKCLGAGTRLYARTQKGEMPATLKDLVRLDPTTVKLWNGSRWTQVVRWEKVEAEGLEFEFRSGEKVTCTPEHRWPTTRGLLEAKDMETGDVVGTTTLPDNAASPDLLPGEDVGWFVGLYLAEGSKGNGGKAIQIASHINEKERFNLLTKLAQKYHGTCQMHPTGGNAATINLHGPVLHGILDTYINGSSAQNKHLSMKCWERDNGFLRAVMEGYLHGDGHLDKQNRRHRLGFCRNNNLANDLRTLAGRLGATLTLKPVFRSYQGGRKPAFEGEWRWERSGHHNEKDRAEVVAIRKARGRIFYDVEVEDEPHLFATASGLLTHNSNAMPSSVQDRFSCKYEYVFLFAKQARYFFDLDAVKVPHSYDDEGNFEPAQNWNESGEGHRKMDQTEGQLGTLAGSPRRFGRGVYSPNGKNPGDIALFPEEREDLRPLPIQSHDVTLGVEDFRDSADFIGRVVDQLEDTSTRMWSDPSRTDSGQDGEAVSHIVEEFFRTRPVQPNLSVLRGTPYATVTVEQSSDEIRVEFGRCRWVLRREGLSRTDSKKCQIRRHSFAVNGEGLDAMLVLVNWVPSLPLPPNVLDQLRVLRAEADGVRRSTGQDATIGNHQTEGVRHPRSPSTEVAFVEGLLAVALHQARVTMTTPPGVLLPTESSDVTGLRAPFDGTGFHAPILPLETPQGKPLGDVWKIPHSPYRGAHFATWPKGLVERMILAGTSSKGRCPTCKAPWQRVSEITGQQPARERNRGGRTDGFALPAQWKGGKPPTKRRTVDWEPTCDCPQEAPERCVVLDPFSGSATTGLMAMQHDRDYIGLDLNAGYLELADARLTGRKAPATSKNDEPDLIEELFG